MYDFTIDFLTSIYIRIRVNLIVIFSIASLFEPWIIERVSRRLVTLFVADAGILHAHTRTRSCGRRRHARQHAVVFTERHTRNRQLVRDDGIWRNTAERKREICVHTIVGGRHKGAKAQIVRINVENGFYTRVIDVFNRVNRSDNIVGVKFYGNGTIDEHTFDVRKRWTLGVCVWGGFIHGYGTCAAYNM